MPTFLEGDIPIGNVQSGQLILKNVVIETALPYKPPTEGGFRDVPCTGDKCRINPDYVPSGNERLILYSKTDKKLMTIDATEGMPLLRDGWTLIGAFDPATAESIADRLAADPPVDNDAIQKDIWLRKFKILGMAAAKIPLGSAFTLVAREKSLGKDLARGKIKPLNLTSAKQVADNNVQFYARGTQQAEDIARRIDSALATTPNIAMPSAGGGGAQIAIGAPPPQMIGGTRPPDYQTSAPVIRRRVIPIPSAMPS